VRYVLEGAMSCSFEKDVGSVCDCGAIVSTLVEDLASLMIVLEFELLLLDEMFILYDFIVDVDAIFDLCSVVKYLGYNGVNLKEVFLLVLNQTYKLI
jgi:hypothetical protein